MMKRILCAALMLTALLSLAACGRTMRKAEEIVESVMPSMTVTPTAEPEAFSSAAPETPDPRHVLGALRGHALLRLHCGQALFRRASHPDRRGADADAAGVAHRQQRKVD